MKWKRYISLLLLAVYLFATAGVAVASLSCRCVAMRARTAHVCCSHCAEAHSDDLSTAKTSMRAPCCSNNHSTEVDLYTASFADHIKLFRAVVTDLPAALAAEDLPTVSRNESRIIVYERRVPLSEEGFARCVGLRAPPVLA